ncbi:protein S40-1-like [Cornus florida]|uniref:protein S40-1-like n=1 Tax=Cornus florida TaxID=4283 RepID=UPI0028966240|nr:protein S40-1-like [Cornus florida]
MEGRYDLYRQSMRNEEFQEEDVWAVWKERKHFNSQIGTSSSTSIAPRRLPTAAKMIPRAINQEQPKMVQQSAPVHIPDWSKIYGANNSKKASKDAPWHDDDNHDHDDDDGNVIKDSWESGDDDDDDDGYDGNMMPPHEWIAKKLARSQISSFSVCEGAGRTLKGRDLSRVRNAVLTKTGFLE